LIESSGVFSKKEMDEVLELGYLNALFLMGRSIGIIGHVLDQKRLQQRLYRHPLDDILYLSPPAPSPSKKKRKKR
jgi:citrate synthase